MNATEAALFSEVFLSEAKRVIDGLDLATIEESVDLLAQTRERGGGLSFWASAAAPGTRRKR